MNSVFLWRGIAEKVCIKLVLEIRYESM
jgi:hypothetical protein